MTKDELKSLALLSETVAEMAKNMITKDLLASEINRLDQVMSDHTKYTQEISLKETARLDAIRVVDATAISVANERAVEQASVLAAQVSSSAETLRGLVATTAAAVAASLNQVSSELTKRIAELERKQFEAQGRSGLSTPLLMMIAALGGGIVGEVIRSLTMARP